MTKDAMDIKAWINVFTIIHYNWEYECYDLIQDLKRYLLDTQKFNLTISESSNDTFEMICRSRLFIRPNFMNGTLPQFVWGLLVLNYGDYGTGPSSGWIDENNVPKVIEMLDTVNYDLYASGRPE